MVKSKLFKQTVIEKRVKRYVSNSYKQAMGGKIKKRKK
jgi:hypothetical protein|tara:strand:+ start:741 stop:854 length:114 start_codon:yes stop_codon:yes gene_type:complete